MSRFENLQSLENRLHERVRMRSKLCMNLQKELYCIVLLTQISSPNTDSRIFNFPSHNFDFMAIADRKTAPRGYIYRAVERATDVARGL